MKILVIEDEIKTAKELKRLIENVDKDLQVVALLHSVTAARQWLSANPHPDLIFSDIQLGDGLSFDIYRDSAINVPVIFCTAFDEYAIRAFEINSIDYLLKPIDETMLEQSLHKYQRLKGLFDSTTNQHNMNRIAGMLDAGYKKSILVYFKDKIIPIKTIDISFIHAANGLVHLHTSYNHRYTTQYTMDQLETILNPWQFFKANRQFIINRDYIESVAHYFNRRLCIKVTGETPEDIIVSKIKAASFLKWMEQ